MMSARVQRNYSLSHFTITFPLYSRAINGWSIIFYDRSNRVGEIKCIRYMDTLLMSEKFKRECIEKLKKHVYIKISRSLFHTTRESKATLFYYLCKQQIRECLNCIVSLLLCIQQFNFNVAIYAASGKMSQVNKIFKHWIF